MPGQGYLRGPCPGAARTGPPGCGEQLPRPTLSRSGLQACRGWGSSLDLPISGPVAPCVPSETHSICCGSHGAAPKLSSGPGLADSLGSPGHSPPSEDEQTADPRGHSCAQGSRLGRSRTGPGGCGLSPPANWSLSLQDTQRLTPPWVMLPGPPGGHSSAGPPPAHLPPLSPYRSFQNLLPKSSLQEACQVSASEEPRLGGADPDRSGPPLPSPWGAGAGDLPSCRGAHRWHHQAGTPGV